jgi:hypothetical protein
MAQTMDNYRRPLKCVSDPCRLLDLVLRKVPAGLRPC